MRSKWIFLFLIVIQYGSYYVVGHVETSETGWFEARKRCIEERKTDMFDPSERRYLEPSQVANNKYYWVGGFETSEWRWTDNTPLFTNPVLCDVPTHVDDEDVKLLPYNSVLKCYRKCDNPNYIGLFGSKCYCFDKINPSTCSKERENINRCFGNPMDQCGTESRMSVYYLDVPFKLDGEANYQCAYSKLYWYRYDYSIELHPYDCDESLHYICDKEANNKIVRCRDGLCLSPNKASWTSSNQSCTLAKFSSSKKTDFIDFLKDYRYVFWYTYRYWTWIGLHKQRSRHWVDGKTEQLDFGNSDQDLLCLALMKADGRVSEHWIPCSESHKALCSSGEHSENDVTGTTSQTTEQSEIGEERALIETNTGKIGIYVGVSVGCLVVLVVIGIIVVFIRKQLFCFTKREDVKTTSRENMAYICSNDLENQDALHEGGTRGFCDLTTNQNRPDSANEGNTYYNISKTVPMSAVDTGNHNNGFSNDRENYDTVHRIANVDENAYEFIKPQPHTEVKMSMKDRPAENFPDYYNL